ncbi:hypothetical protein BBJ29_009134 [Phytophthora kernoviae]|uniref:Ion transport domain-containing protein n=1 Tax=Phytophthora kernoviae TaxID=325452 RepID=A0A3F2RCN5_9STRA|nr:hypothetical protein BBJ29_009134 [Phytophthora kernoviae]RLN53041.1 hypothetical protein BBP00_00009451 [Phytophthora kernoviae]
MPVHASISPTFSNTEAELDELVNSTFYAESMIRGTGTGTTKHTTTLGRFEKIFVFMVDPNSSRAASLYSFFIACAAFCSCFILFLQTLDGPNHNSTFPEYPKLPDDTGYYDSDLVFTIIFTPELLIRLIIWPSLWYEHEYLTERRLKPFLRDFFNWFDVAAIVPFYSDLVFGKEKSFVIMRLCRLLRIFKLARNHSGTYILLRAIRASLAPISVALIFFTEIVFVFSVVMYLADPAYDRNKSGFSDLLTSGYFVVVTVATIGYGDLTPTKGNVVSRVFAVMIIMSGTLFLAMPLAIIGTEFDRAWKQHAESVKKFQQLQAGAHVATPVNIDLAAAAGDDRAHKKHEILVKYNAPNKLYLGLAALTGYVVLEYLFTLTYLFELAAALYVCEDYRAYLKNPVVLIEMLSFIPFFVFEGRRFFGGATPIYVITPASQDFLTILRLLRLSRIFKIQQRIPVTKVLWESISKTSTRLAIPYFMLMMVSTILSFIMYELEKGHECFYGQECIVGGRNMTYPVELEGSLPGKRFLVNFKGEISSFDDFFSAFWFVIVTLATVGYGDMEPVTSSGKLVAVAAMIFGACYTAMPLTLVGSQFNKSYREHKRREALLRTKHEVGKPYVVQQSENQRWENFSRNESFAQMLELVRDRLEPLLDSIEKSEVDILDDINQTEIFALAKELKQIIFSERLQVMQVSVIVNRLRKEGIRLAEQQVMALQSVT